MVTTASGAGRAGAASRPWEGAAGCACLACLPPRDKVTCSGSCPVPGLGGRPSRQGHDGVGCSGGRDAGGHAGAGCGAPNQPYGTTRYLQGAPRGCPRLAPNPSAPSSPLPSTLACARGGSLTLGFERLTQEESCDLPCSSAPVVHWKCSEAPLSASAQLRHHPGRRGDASSTWDAEHPGRASEKHEDQPQERARHPSSEVGHNYYFIINNNPLLSAVPRSLPPLPARGLHSPAAFHPATAAWTNNLHNLIKFTVISSEVGR